MIGGLRVTDLGELSPESETGIKWESLVARHPCSGFMQSLHWAEFKRYQGLLTVHLGVFLHDVLIGGAIFYCAPYGKGAGFLVAPDGPLLPWHQREIAQGAIGLMQAHVSSIATKYGVMAMRIAPRILDRADALPLLSFNPAPLAINEHQTLLIDLRQSEDDLLAAMHPKGRYNIGLAQRSAVRVYEQSSGGSAAKLYEVMQAVGERNEFFVEPYSHFLTLLETLAPRGFVKVFFAEHETDLLGALLMVAYGGRATYLYGGTTDTKRNLMAGYLLQWEAMRAAKSLGCTEYDFWGFDATLDPEHPYAGFSRFKSQFGGQATEYIGTLDHYFVSNLADAVVRAFAEVSS